MTSEPNCQHCKKPREADFLLCKSCGAEVHPECSSQHSCDKPSQALQKARELAELHEYFDFKDSSKNLGHHSDSICLRDDDFRIDISDNNMSVYEDCKFVQCDTECSCWDDVANTLRKASEFIELSYKYFPSIVAELEKVTEENEKLKENWYDAMSWMQSVSVFCGMESKRRENGEVVFDEKKMAKWLEHIDNNLPPEINSLKEENQKLREAIDNAAHSLNHIRNKAHSGDDFEFEKIAEDGLKKLRPFLHLT